MSYSEVFPGENQADVENAGKEEEQPPQSSSGTVATLRLRGCGFDPQLGHTKDCKDGTHGLLTWHSAFGV